MKKIIAAMFFIFCFSLIYGDDTASTNLFAAYPYKNASWKSKTTIQSPEETVTFEQSVFLKGKKMRTEGKFLNRATNEIENQIMIIDETMMYSINPDKKQGMKYSLKSPNNPAKSGSEINKCRQTAKKTGNENINGVQYDKYEYTCEFGRENMKITEYRNSSGFAIKTVSKMDNVVTTVETTELKDNVSVPDSKFIPDKNIKFMDMDSMMKTDYKRMLEAQKKADGNDSEDAGNKMMKDMMKNMMGK